MSLGTAILNLLFPPKCPFCHVVLEDPEAGLCPDCQVSLPWLTGQAAERKIEFADGCYSPLAYRDRVREGVHHLKFHRCRASTAPFGMLMAQCARDHLTEKADAVTWTPLSRKRLRQRGFDQAELLARAVGKELGLPVVPTLEKFRNTQPQSSLTEAAQRRANARGAYRLRPGAQVSGQRLLLVDDVVTSGATLDECAYLLKQAGAQRVWCLTLAQAGHKGKNQEQRKN
ncbi:ComF family protein [Pseudoflavonifractor sp. AF19-9AC]|uniref:ComF family protein n=1 Tax=Pseudoflavonifractor sp. AF19-9AC TaxID=2292244 RepID=UPI000E50B11B|nr:ComF family protein [Pseudoflavonifractor sp. AF19-9AC]RHR11102.1 ComF family protein [Pseudoflavonifractor sp. AF19-9AC]